MEAKYFKSADDVGFIDPMQRFWAKILGKNKVVITCKNCKKIPTEIFGGYCLDCKKENL